MMHISTKAYSLIGCCLLSVSVLLGQTVTPTASVVGGKFTSVQTVTLTSTSPNAAIYYTTDGNEPNTTSQRYTAPLSISRTTTLRARAYASGLAASAIMTHTYLLNVNHSFPIVALSFKPTDFFNADTGLYVKFDDPIERPIHIEFFEPNSNRAAFSAAVKTEIQGSTSAQLPQKSLEIKAGGSGIAYPVFPTRPFTAYRRFVLRNGGQDQGITMFRDEMAQSLALRTGDLGGVLAQPTLFMQDYRPAVVYYNGAYWGIHNVRERMNRFYVEQHFGLPQTDFDLIENWGVANNGDLTAFNSFYNGLNNRNLANGAEYETLKNEIDINNFMDYAAFNVLIDNEDWPVNNVRMWRPKAGGKWRWLSYDHDFSFGLFSPLGWNSGDATQNSINRLFNPSGFAWPNTNASTLLFRKCFENPTFRRDFINRSADFLNTMLKPNRVVNRINEFEAQYMPEMAQHGSRWGSPNMITFPQNVQKMRDFANNRPAIVRQQYDQQFAEITGSADITLSVSPAAAGSIQFSTLNLSGQNLPFTGTYFTGVDIPAQAVAAQGYRFDRWSDGSGTNPNILVRLSGSRNLTAIFVPNGTNTNPCATDTQAPTWSNCPGSRTLTTSGSCATTTWTPPAATDNCSTPSVSSTHSSGNCFPIGSTNVVYTATDARGNVGRCNFTVTVQQQVQTSTADIAVSVSSNPATYRQFTPLTFTITARNLSATAFSNVKVEFKYPTGTVKGGEPQPSSGSFRETCLGTIKCYEWTIPSLGANATATLNMPMYVLNTTAPIVGNPILKSSTPADNNAANNSASVAVNAATTARLQSNSVATSPTLLIPVVLQNIFPNPTDRDLVLEIESIDDREVVLNVTNALGKTVFAQKNALKQGQNTIVLDVSGLESGLFYVVPETSLGRQLPTKFVKMD